MAPLRRLRPNPYEKPGAAGSVQTATDSGFGSATQSTQPILQRPAATASSELNQNGKRELPHDLATTDANRKRPPPLTLRDLEAVRTIGSGGWGSVHAVRVKRQSSHLLERTGATFALKAVTKNSFRDMERNDKGPNPQHAVDRRDAERLHLSSLPWNPFIAGLIDTYTDLKNTYLAMEYGPCETLYTQIRSAPYLTDREIKFYFINLVLALEFLHNHDVVHCDVKPENLVLGADGYLMLTDFGLAQPLNGNNRWNRMGTLEYMSPEVIADDPMDTREKRAAADWWAAAICLYEMKMLTHPFDCNDREELQRKHKSYPVRWDMNGHVDEGLQELVGRMLHADLPHRLGATEVPEGRKGAFINRELRRHRFLSCVDWRRIEMHVATAPRVADPAPEEEDRRHCMPFVEQSKVPGLSLKRPAPRLEWTMVKKEKEPSSRKKRRMGGEFSGLPRRPTRSPSMAVERGSVAAEA